MRASHRPLRSASPHIGSHSIGCRPIGDPSAEDRLARNLTDSLEFPWHEPIERYLRGRTAFFDRVVVNGLERDVGQIVCVGAGYDGRSLRYAKPGVTWFEVDHPVTQQDKRARLQRLGIDAPNVRFVALDLSVNDVGATLLRAGWEPDASSLMLCEGLAVYLEVPALESLLGGLRRLASAATRLAISLRLPGAEPARRERFQAAVAALGEPTRNTLTAEQSEELLAAARWRTIEVSERAQGAGLAMAVPIWKPASPGAEPTASGIARYLEQLYENRGVEGLGATSRRRTEWRSSGSESSTSACSESIAQMDRPGSPAFFRAHGHERQPSATSRFSGFEGPSSRPSGAPNRTRSRRTTDTR